MNVQPFGAIFVNDNKKYRKNRQKRNYIKITKEIERGDTESNSLQMPTLAILEKVFHIRSIYYYY